MTTKTVNYEQFGAVGDGVTNDVEAISACHTYANENKLKVKLNPDKRYYIPPMDKAIEIKTDTDFSNAYFIIDDRSLTAEDPRRSVSLFRVRSYYPHVCLTAENSEAVKNINENGGLKSDTKKIDLGLGYPALLKIENDKSKRFIRYGANQNAGGNQKEIVLVDKDGNIDPETPIVFPFDSVSAIYAFRADEEPMRISGGIFNLRANSDHSSYKYFSRNIDICRSNLTVEGLQYKITDEPLGKYDSQPYISFLITENSNNVIFKNLLIDGHRTYYAVGSGGSEVGMGAKSINATCSNRVVYENCKQTNFFTDESETEITQGLWGIMSSNYSKNLFFLNSTLSRFDAHCGIYNSTVKNCRIIGVRIVGAGELVIENCEFFCPNIANTFISTREDFGSFWRGKITVKDIFVHTTGKNNEPVNFITGHWYNHNFGYEVRFADEIIVENFDIDDKRRNVILFAKNFCRELEGSLLPEIDGKPNINPAKPPKRIIIRNKNKNVRFVIPDKNEYKFFADTEFDIEL